MLIDTLLESAFEFFDDSYDLLKSKLSFAEMFGDIVVEASTVGISDDVLSIYGEEVVENTISNDIVNTNHSVSKETADLWADKIVECAKKYDLNPFLVASQAKLESTWNPVAMGTYGDTGLIQILPRTSVEIAQALGYGSNFYPELMKDPYLNIEFGSYYLSQIASQTDKFVDNEYAHQMLTLLSYNQGVSRAVENFLAGRTTSVYTDHVLNNYYNIISNIQY